MIDENGAQVGVVSPDQARQMARERGVDLVEIAPLSRPPVCKLLDYGKFLYEEKKKKKISAKKHHVQQLKEMRLRPKTDKHDIETKVNHAREFLEHGDKVLFTVVFRGRENAHRELGRGILDRIKLSLEEVSKVESDVRMEGNRMHLILLPKPGRPVPTSKKTAEPKPVAVDGEPHAENEDGEGGEKAV